MGYNYGVWLVVTDKSILDLIKKNNSISHTAHITIMCNMSYSDALELNKEINEKFNNGFDVTVSNKYSYFNDKSEKYFKDDSNELCASGFYCTIKNWESIMELAKKYKGSLPKKPHISVVYKENETDLPENIFLHEDKSLNLYVYAANINSDFPIEWYLIN